MNPRRARCVPYVLTTILVALAPLTAQSLDWVHQFGSPTPADDRIHAVAARGDVFVTGQTTGALPRQTSGGGIDGFVRGYDSSGTELWTVQFGTVADDVPLALVVTSTGLYVAGLTHGTFAGQISSGWADAFVRKYDLAGNELWTRQFGTPAFDAAWGLAAGSWGVLVVGDTGGALPGQVAAGSADAYVRRYDAAGNELWTRQFGSSSYDAARRVAVSEDAVFVVGFGRLAGQPHAGNSDVFLQRLDLDGCEVWTRQFGSSAFDVGWRLSIYENAIYLGGWTVGVLPGQLHAGSEDAFLCRFDSGGTLTWLRQFGTAGPDRLTGGLVADAGGVTVSGDTTGSLPGQTSAGGRDLYVRRYGIGGTRLWTVQFGTTGDDFVFAMSGDARRTYVGGWVGGTFSGQTSAGGDDAIVLAFDFTATLGKHAVATLIESLADHVGALPVSLFLAPSHRARQSLRRSMEVRLRNAAAAAGACALRAACAILVGLELRVDGATVPADWMAGTVARETIAAALRELIALLNAS